MSMASPTCSYQKADGSRCRARALPGRDVCVFHAPDMAGKCHEARRRGGFARRRPTLIFPEAEPEPRLDSVGNVATFLATAVGNVAKGQLDVKIGNCLAVLVGQLIRALEGGDVETRLKELEERLQGPRAGRGRANFGG
jgi:hypothetical protein